MPSPLPPLTSLSHTLAHFSSSPTVRFRIVHTIPPSLARLPTERLFILDSSFNPPTWAHMRMCLSALQSASSKTRGDGGKGGPKRLLLLLATKNADKAAAPADFEDRLAMMGRFALDLGKQLRHKLRNKRRKEEALSSEMEGKEERRGEEYVVEEGVSGENDRDDIDEGGEMAEETDGNAAEELESSTAASKPTTEKGPEDLDVVIDIGVTKEAMFVEKARVIEDSGFYVGPPPQKAPVEQTHLTGYDTLIRLVDPKYYPPQHTLAPLKGLFEKHHVQVTMRTPPPQQDQIDFLVGLQTGAKEAQGWRREWAERIELVEGRKEGEKEISSTKARECFRVSSEGKSQGSRFCTSQVVNYILDKGLYLERKKSVTGESNLLLD